MANLFSEVFKRAGDLVSYPVKMGKDMVTNPSKGWKELTHLYSHNEHKDQDLMKGLGIGGWVGKHPQETAAAVVGTVFGGWMAAGAYGAGAAGGATAGAAGTTGATAAGTGAAASGASTGAISAGTVIGQTVPATPGMIAAANGGGAAIGTGANATSAAYALTATPSYSIASGASSTGVSLASGGAPASHLTGQTASVGSASGTNPASTATGWKGYVKDAIRLYNATNQKEQQEQGPTFDDSLLRQTMQQSQQGQNYQSTSNALDILKNPYASTAKAGAFNTNAIGINQF